ncbi:MAG: hypothetical protein QOH03_1712 [Kribbellaceae bacterium]|jgi:predicted CDP-diglyceride synthetase/phosphatidate cytidylyltransferase|nr:hypothetical protein [Kribbellaceae bacterium]
MVQVIVLTFLAGVVAANGVPHFVRGITGQEYPNVTGNSAVRNVVGGWVALVVAALLVGWSGAARHQWAALVAGALGVLGMALFHARGGAFWLNTRWGRANPPRVG